MFDVICSNCFESFEATKGYALSCTCFVCGSCSSTFPPNAKFQSCAMCGFDKPQLASLEPNKIPSEIHNLLENTDNLFQGLMDVVRFQFSHLRKIASQAIDKSRHFQIENDTV